MAERGGGGVRITELADYLETWGGLTLGHDPRTCPAWGGHPCDTLRLDTAGGGFIVLQEIGRGRFYLRGTNQEQTIVSADEGGIQQQAFRILTQALLWAAQ